MPRAAPIFELKKFQSPPLKWGDDTMPSVPILRREKQSLIFYAPRAPHAPHALYAPYAPTRPRAHAPIARLLDKNTRPRAHAPS